MVIFSTSLLVMRWGLLSALLMFLTSLLKINLQRAGQPIAGILCSSIGVGISCWFVTGLLGLDLNQIYLQTVLNTAEQAFFYAIQQSPDLLVPN